MHPVSAHAAPGRDEAPGPYGADPEQVWWEDDEDPAQGCTLAEILAECEQAAEDQAYAAALAARAGTAGAMAAVTVALTGRRGPGQPGSAEIAPGEYGGRAAQFAAGMLLDVMPGRSELAAFADEAAGPYDSFAGVSDDELLGVLCAWDRVATHAAARRYAAIAELVRRRPAAGSKLEGEARLPESWDEFTPSELCAVLSRSRHDADGMLGLACDLEEKLPGTKAAFRDGILSEDKVVIIARATTVLTAEEARAAEDKVLDRAGRLTPAGLRSAIARAVIAVAPGKARKRREQAAKQARVERWGLASGNAGLAGLELPPAKVLAADQVLTARARLLREAGLEGGLDELRARAFLDLLLGTDSRPRVDTSASPEAPADPDGSLPAGFAGRVNLAVPLATLLGLAERPGEIPGIGAIDPALARDLAAAAAGNPKTTWCVTVTDQDGHAVGHGCARPEPRARPGPRAGPGPGFGFTATDEHGPPGGYGTWRLATGPGRRELLVTLDPIATGECDHRYQANGHDPGVKLRHLTQIRHATCTGPACRRPSANADFEHNVPYQAGGRTCLCNGDPKCRYDHRLKQHPKWKTELLPDGTVRWTTPSGRQYTAEPTRYPV